MEVVEVVANTTLGSVTEKLQAVSCTPLILDVVISSAAVLIFLGTVFITYFIDDPGFKKLKMTETKELNVIQEADNKYINYLAQRKFHVHTKGHTFSSFSPVPRALDDISQTNADSITQAGWKPRRRACSESHPGILDDNMSETQVILEHMLRPIKHGSSQHSLRGRSSYRLSFSSVKKIIQGHDTHGHNASSGLDEVTSF